MSLEKKERRLWSELPAQNMIVIGWDRLGDTRTFLSIGMLEIEVRVLCARAGHAKQTHEIGDKKRIS